MRYFFGRVFVEYWDNDRWNLSALLWYKYLLGRIWGVIGSAGSDKDYRHVPRSKVHYVKKG